MVVNIIYITLYNKIIFMCKQKPKTTMTYLHDYIDNGKLSAATFDILNYIKQWI